MSSPNNTRKFLFAGNHHFEIEEDAVENADAPLRVGQTSSIAFWLRKSSSIFES
jgi:hypothetical protein